MQSVGQSEGQSESGRANRSHVLLAALCVGVLAFAIQRGIAGLHRFPVPMVHDEFAYLLASDTFASGRITNPSHPCWVHFDTFHVLQRPTYQAKYPPGQGAALAFGTVLFGHPAYGVWLVLALALAACVWCLASVVPLSHAVLAALAFGVQPTVLQGWGHSYWGGGLALLGGALVFGSLLRLMPAAARPSIRIAVPFVLGAFVLANTRPLEGGLAVALGVLALAALRPASERVALLRSLAPALVLAVVLSGAWTLYYNAEVTGDPLRLPYLEWSAQESPHPELHPYAGSRSLGILEKGDRLRGFLLGGLLSLLAPLALFQARRPFVRYGLLVSLPIAALSVFATKAWPHYLAPVVPLLLLLLAAGFDVLGSWGGRASGPKAKAWGAWLLALLLGLQATKSLLGLHAWIDRPAAQAWPLERQALLERLEADDEQHLVLVSYPPTRSLHAEWVFNAADIDGADVVWARDLGPEANEALLRHFRGRRVWTLRPSAEGAFLKPLRDDARGD